MAPHSSTLAWKIPWIEEPGRLQSMGSLRSDTTEWLHFHFSLSCTGEGNGNPLQCSCLENPRDGGAWWAAVSGVTQNRSRLKWLSNSCIGVYKDPSRRRRGTVLEIRAFCVPLSTHWELKPPISYKLCLVFSYSATLGRGSQDFGQQQYLIKNNVYYYN